MKRNKSIVSKHEIACTGDLQASVRGASRRVKGLSADLSLGFLRGYQSGYEDAINGKHPKHFVNLTEEQARNLGDREKRR